MSFEYTLRLATAQDANTFGVRLKSCLLAVQPEDAPPSVIWLRAPDTRRVWAFDVRLLVQDERSWLLEISLYSLALYQVVRAALTGLEYRLDEEGGPRSLEQAFRVS